MRIDALVEVFNVFNVTNMLGTSNRNYSGFVNALVRDSNDPPIQVICDRAGSARR